MQNQETVYIFKRSKKRLLIMALFSAVSFLGFVGFLVWLLLETLLCNCCWCRTTQIVIALLFTVAFFVSTVVIIFLTLSKERKVIVDFSCKKFIFTGKVLIIDSTKSRIKRCRNYSALFSEVNSITLDKYRKLSPDLWGMNDFTLICHIVIFLSTGIEIRIKAFCEEVDYAHRPDEYATDKTRIVIEKLNCILENWRNDNLGVKMKIE